MGDFEHKFWKKLKPREVSRILNFVFVLKAFADTNVDINSDNL